MQERQGNHNASTEGHACAYVALLSECVCLVVFNTRTQFDVAAAAVAAARPMPALRTTLPARVGCSGSAASRLLNCTRQLRV